MPVEPATWCVFISGSRDLGWRHEPLIREKLLPFKGYGSTVIHGMGEGRRVTIPGCDRVADRVAQDEGFHILAIPALWKLHNKSAGPIRNRLCVEVWAAHYRAGYRLAMLAFSTGGPGTEGALALADNLGTIPHQIEKITVTL